ncbi:MAG: nuclear transport factor 2 family protein [Pseudomonadota bacterium]
MSEGAMLQTLMDLEEQVWTALETGDAAADESLLSPDFLGIYPTGFAGRDDHSGQLADGPTVAWHQISGARAMALSPEVALLAYRADFARSANGPAEVMYVSSIWRKAPGGWTNIFSQDTLPGDAVP